MPEFYIGLNSDIVFLLNVTGSMSNSLPSLKIILTNITQKIEQELNKKFRRSPNVRYKVCGFRDQEFDGDKWFIDLPFVRNIEEVSNHLNHKDMEPFGGTGKATSLLDAIYKIGMMPVNASKTLEDSNKWRKGARAGVLIITDATFKNATLPEIAGFGSDDIFNKLNDKKLSLIGLIPEWSGYDDLGAWPNTQFTNYIEGAPVANLGKDGPEGNAAQIAAVTALEKMSVDKDTFSAFIKILGASLSKEVEVVEA